MNFKYKILLKNNNGDFNYIQKCFDNMYGIEYPIKWLGYFSTSPYAGSNIGARRNRNIKDHLFVINGILNDVQQNTKSEGVDLGIYDIAKCFDKIWYS